MTIREFINKTKIPNRDKIVIDRINDFYRNNVDALNDGIVYNYIIIGDVIINRLLEPYNINWDEFRQFKKTNEVLKDDHNVVGKPVYLCLMTSYFVTKDRIFLDMLGCIEIGSKFSKYFRHGVSSPEKMKYVIEHKLSNKSLIKKHGSLFLVMQEQMTTILNTPALKERWKRGNDRDIQYIINRISSSINDMMKGISKEYYGYLDKETESVIISQSELNLDGGKASLSNNSIDVQNLRNIVINYMPTNLDYEVMKVVKCNKPIEKFIMKKLLLDKEKKYFSKLGIVYIDYYVERYGASITNMKKDFIPKLLSARLNNPEVSALMNEIAKETKKIAENYNDSDSQLHTNAGAISYVNNQVKPYVIIKIRKIMNDL